VQGLAAALVRVDLLVACDSGPVHLAAAAGRPVLALFGPTSHVRWGPPAPGRVLRTAPDCSPCSNHGDASCPGGHGHRCLEDLPVDAVVAAARDLLAATAPPARGAGPRGGA
jgi:ADP-heptose:LPS heptosyltransferase